MIPWRVLPGSQRQVLNTTIALINPENGLFERATPLLQGEGAEFTFSLILSGSWSIFPFCDCMPKKGVIFLTGVFLNEDDYNFDIALRRFKKQVEKAGILSEMKKRQHYEKPSVMRKKKKAAARKRLMKKIRKMNMA